MYCEKTKDRLLMMLNCATDPLECSPLDNMASLCGVCEIVATVLTHTEGLWLEAGYAYKAVEIAAAAIRHLDDYLTDENRHHASKRKLEAIKTKLRRLEARYYKLNHNQRYDDEVEAVKHELHGWLRHLLDGRKGA